MAYNAKLSLDSRSLFSLSNKIIDRAKPPVKVKDFKFEFDPFEYFDDILTVEEKEIKMAGDIEKVKEILRQSMEAQRKKRESGNKVFYVVDELADMKSAFNDDVNIKIVNITSTPTVSSNWASEYKEQIGEEEYIKNIMKIKELIAAADTKMKKSIDENFFAKMYNGSFDPEDIEEDTTPVEKERMKIYDRAFTMSDMFDFSKKRIAQEKLMNSMVEISEDLSTEKYLQYARSIMGFDDEYKSKSPELECKDNLQAAAMTFQRRTDESIMASLYNYSMYSRPSDAVPKRKLFELLKNALTNKSDFIEFSLLNLDGSLHPSVINIDIQDIIYNLDRVSFLFKIEYSRAVNEFIFEVKRYYKDAAVDKDNRPANKLYEKQTSPIEVLRSNPGRTKETGRGIKGPKIGYPSVQNREVESKRASNPNTTERAIDL